MAKGHRKNTMIDLSQGGLPIINLPIDPDLHSKANSKGFDIHARVVDRFHIALACRSCGRMCKHKIFMVRDHHPQCPHCLEDRRHDIAERAGFMLLRPDPHHNQYAWYLAPCGHEVRRQRGLILLIAAGQHGLRCETCHLAKEAAEATSRGWTWLSRDPEGDVNYRHYLHSCGHKQRVARANMQSGRFGCAACGERWSAAPSNIYALRMHFPGYGPVVKVGFSRDPKTRMRTQFGIKAELGVELIDQIPIATGHVAIKEEKQLHKKLRTQFPDAAVRTEIIRDNMNVVSEVYAGYLEAVILLELQRIAAKLSSRSRPRKRR